jgi:nucleoside-diphosphate kinase
MIEQTFLLVKPDGVQRALVGKIISRLEDSGLKVVAMKMVLPDKKLAGIHYAEDKAWMESVGAKTLAAFKEKGIPSKETALQIGNRVRSYLIEYITSGPVVAAVIEGNEAIFITRKILGATEPRKADPSSVRGAYSISSYELADEQKRAVRNIAHASEDKKTAEREISIWFKPEELVKYKRIDEGAIY